MAFPEQFPALDPGVGNGAALTTLLESSNGLRYGIEIDAHRSQQAHSLGIEVLYAKYGTTVVVSGDFECYGDVSTVKVASERRKCNIEPL